MAKTKNNDNIEEVVAEVIPFADEVDQKGKKKPGRPKKVDGLVITDNQHYFISQPNDVTQAISNLSAIERNCWLQILRGIQKNKDLPDGDPKNTSLLSLVANSWSVSLVIVQIWIMLSML